MGFNIKKEMEAAFSPPEPQEREKFLSNLRYPNLTYPEFIFLQIGYIRKRIWISSLAMLSAVVGMICFIPGDNMVFLWITSAVVPFLAMLTASEISRSGIFGMSEIESGCRFSMPQVVGARMIILGVCNFMLILAVSVLSGIFTPINVVKSALYIFTPFITENACSLIIFNKMKGQEGVFLSAAAALGISLFGTVLFRRCVYNGRFEDILTVAFCIAGTFMAAAQMKKLLKGKEIYLWN